MGKAKKRTGIYIISHTNIVKYISRYTQYNISHLRSKYIVKKSTDNNFVDAFYLIIL